MQGNENKILPRIGCLIESPGFYRTWTATENLKIFAELRGINKPSYIKGALELVNLPYRDKKLFSEYSLGMKQRLAIALAVMHDRRYSYWTSRSTALTPSALRKSVHLSGNCVMPEARPFWFPAISFQKFLCWRRHWNYWPRRFAGRRKPERIGGKERKVRPFHRFGCKKGRAAYR